MNRRVLRRAAVPVAALSLVLTACGGQDEGSGGTGDGGSSDGGSSDSESLSGEIVTDGSSTVQPLTQVAGELFKEEQPDVNVSVGTSGTGGGFEKFCIGDTDISNASRPIDEEDEVPVCKKNGIEFTELQVATDALTVVVSSENDFVECLTTEELATMWAPEAEKKVTTWDQVNPDFPSEPLELFGPGTDSGTFDYFTDEINGEEGASRADYNASEDDNTIVQGVSGSPNAIGYFGFSYFEENSDSLKALEIDSGDGCVAPSAEAAQDGSYTPLARPLFVYPATSAVEDKPQVAAFLDFYAANNAEIAEAAKFIPLNEDQTTELQDMTSELTGS
ncbi:MAG: PstS family phosphate ABC transporter substrate-binding protein [Nocardioidaceae bacterium]|nr:PstS family phosphate ABC transporter substrate-binding protein [Nocardioidaceae bacterium]